MGLFTPIVKVDDDRENFGWILEILNKCPSTEELEQKLAELDAACKRAEDAKATINSVLNNATAAAKAELKNEIEATYNKCVAIQNEVVAARDAVQKVVDDAVTLAKTELQTAIKTEIAKAENAASRAETVVETAVENLKSENALLVQAAIDEELVRAKNELDASVQTKADSLLSEIELAKTNLQTLINNKTSELNTAINNKLTETKQLIEAENESAVNEVKEYINTNPFYKRGEFVLIPANWVENRQTVSVPGVETDSDIIITHAPNSYAAYIAHGVHCSEVEAGLLRFACESVPTENITVNIMILLRGAEL